MKSLAQWIGPSWKTSVEKIVVGGEKFDEYLL
jgi:hypothetical protein